MAPVDHPGVVKFTDTVPMMDNDGTTPVNNAADIRKQLIVPMLMPGVGELTVRPGWLPRNYDAGASVYVSGKAIQRSGGAAQGVDIYPGEVAIYRPGQGAYLATKETTTQLNLGTANGSNPRIDVVYARLYDRSIGDSGAGPDNGTWYGYIEGDPAGSPTVPTLPSTDCLPVCAILRPANTNNITSANITDLRKATGLLGGVRYLLPGDDPDNDPGNVPGELRWNRSNKKIEQWDATRWVPLMGSAGVVARYARTSNTSAATSTSFVPDVRIDNVPLVAGRQYRIETNNISVSGAAGDNIRANIFFSSAGTATTGSSALPGAECNVDATAGTGTGGTVQCVTTLVPGSTATYSFLLAHARVVGSGSAILVGNSSLPIQMTVTDLGVAPSSAGTDL